MNSNFSEINLSEDSKTKGFDLQAGQTWIYPTNYPIRDYQYNIVQQALLKNTLVSLPTGLGKTFIAAVVMYNFFRWYPSGKIIFMAPTRPLVRQQIEACYDIMGIPKTVTVEITGTKMSASRESIWKEKRVFFITPQILQNDLEKIIELPEQIKCLVFDEAHRARRNHSYCEVIRKLIPYNKYFRVLALSATPGSSISDVLEVVQNLLISHLEFRTEESIDVKPYVFERNLTTVVVPLGEKLQEIRDDYLQVLEYYTRTLVKYKVIQGNCANLTKGKIFMTLKDFQQKHNSSSSSNYAEIMKSLNICITLYHGFELLVRHGLRSFLSFFDEHKEKPLLRGSFHLVEILNNIKEYLGPVPVIEQLPDGSFVEIPENSKFGHPKFYKLRDILVHHFSQENQSSRVIVFFEYRNSVMEAYALLHQSRPLLKPRIFLGQGGGVTQRQQLKVIELFKGGQCNILLSTCIGEEGLDVGDVDLIVCFDISNKSPIRMVQRMGRTGRKKEGHVTVLVTEGKEQQILKDCLMHKNNIAFHVLSSKELAKGLNADSPRLVPPQIVPKCEKIYITVRKAALSKKSTIKDMFRNISNNASDPSFSPDLEIVEIKERIPAPNTLWDKANPLDKNVLISNVFSKRIEKQRALQSTYLIKHSPSSEVLVNLLQHVDSKRFNLPITQVGCHSQLTQGKNLKQGDIRSMFLKPQSSADFLPRSQAQKIPAIETISQDDNSTRNTRELLAEMSDYLSIQMLEDKSKCKHCPDNFDCNSHCITSQSKEITLMPQDESIFNTITLEDLNLFFEIHVLKLKPNIERKSTDANVNISAQCRQDVCKSLTPQFEEEEPTNSPPLAEKTCSYQAPKTLHSLLNRYSTSILDEDEFLKMQKPQKKADIQQVFHNGSVELNLKNTTTDLSVLDFFKLKSLTDLFPSSKLDSSEETIIYSPDVIENSVIEETKPTNLTNQRKEYNLSPVLCISERARNIKNFQRKLFHKSQDSSNSYESTSSVRGTTTSNKPNFRRLKQCNSPIKSPRKIESPLKFSTHSVKSSSTPFCSKTGSVSQIKSAFNGENCEKEKSKSNYFDSGAEDINNEIDVDDLCDLSVFGLQSTRKNKASTNLPENNLCIEEICDLRMFGIENPTSKHRMDKVDSSAKQINKDSDKNKTVDTILNTTDFRKPSKTALPTQISITQIIDLVNTSEDGSPQKENVTKPHVGLNRDNSTLQLSRASNNVQFTGKDSFCKSSNNFNDAFDNTFYNKSSICDKSFSPKSTKVTQSKGCDNVFCKPTNMKRKKINPFVENEAELASDESFIVSEDEDDEEQNLYDASFIDNCTQNVDTQMHIKYLQSVRDDNFRSPRNRGNFKIPQKPKFNINNIYSQEVHREDDTYLDDSFVVHDEVEDEHHEKSELEILEEKLKRNKKRHKSDDIELPAKRRRIICISSDESD